MEATNITVSVVRANDLPRQKNRVGGAMTTPPTISCRNSGRFILRRPLSSPGSIYP